MSVISVDTELLHLKSGSITSASERIRADVQLMKMGLAELEGAWTGAAAAQFQAIMAEWALTQARVEASLASISLALSTTAASYAQTEEGNARRFSF